MLSLLEGHLFTIHNNEEGKVSCSAGQELGDTKTEVRQVSLQEHKTFKDQYSKFYAPYNAPSVLLYPDSPPWFLLAHQLAKLWFYLSWHDYNTVLKTKRCLKRYDHKKGLPLLQPSLFPYLFMSAISKLEAHWGWAQTLFILTGSPGLSPCKHSPRAWLN